MDEQLDIKELSLSYPAKSRLSPVKLENELEIEQIKWETLAVGRQIISAKGQSHELKSYVTMTTAVAVKAGLQPQNI